MVLHRMEGGQWRNASLDRGRNLTAGLVGCIGLLVICAGVIAVALLLFYGATALMMPAEPQTMVSDSLLRETIRAQRDTIEALRQCILTQADVCPSAF